jgi:hypothetical protein
MTEDQLQRLHNQAIDRRHDLRVCNPEHGRFYAFMAEYSRQVDDPAALAELAASIDEWAERPGTPPDMRDSYRQLAKLARWRQGKLNNLTWS